MAIDSEPVRDRGIIVKYTSRPFGDPHRFIHLFIFFFIIIILRKMGSPPKHNISKIMCEEILKTFVRDVSEIDRKALKVQILNKVALTQVVRKRISF